ncbi:efflux transporter, outer membrane factor (OMF) lipoprotein, NodT family [Solimonas aquatica]|uniref:Efflux transporter, outer membrane factor (OMF) lipoprotein, NodT family n=1 Tax=Solimonas aquatica TaxID=489703 RepID=A0A1H9HWE1_9GAMM|nr:efflux transporter outer membrane subunit [Solimonas aquatica]SEQ66572.1 efflux transporter, outer membrane factor (OMF) lipoprotein, NodT family [Solimonas aquatica]
MSTTIIRSLSLLAAAACGACAVGPDYHAPELTAPAQFKEAEGWQPAAPADDLARGDWWQRFGDAQLDALQAELNRANASIAVSEAAYRQAHALLRNARAAQLPSVGASAAVTRSGRGSASSVSGVSNSYSAGLDAAWELDLWGKLRRNVEAQRASAQASAADLANARLSLQAELASAYFQLRAVDEQQRLYEATIAAYQRSYQIAQNRYAAGVATRADVISAQAQLQNAQAAAIDLQAQRAQYEHAIAVLVGKPPAEFALAPTPYRYEPPAIPAALPAALLQRRPDVAAAERAMAAANAQIGVAVAAYYPDLSFSASGGYDSSRFAHWFEAPYRVWSLGPQLAATLFDGGARSAQVEAAHAAYDGQVASYRLSVLTAFQEVEDALAQLAVLRREQQMQDAATQAALQAAELTLNQYKAGTVDYASVAAAQATALSSQRSQLGIINNRLQASITLIKALGGGWDVKELPAS